MEELIRQCCVCGWYWHSGKEAWLPQIPEGDPLRNVSHGYCPICFKIADNQITLEQLEEEMDRERLQKIKANADLKPEL